MRNYFHRGMLVLFLLLAVRAGAADSLVWRAGGVDADIRSLPLPALLEQVAAATGWQVYVEPGAAHDASAKFSNLPPGEALRLLLGDLNFALVPQTNASPRLYVFRTSRGNATQLVKPAVHRLARAIPNELIVRLKPGANIDDLAQTLGAKVIGRIGVLNAYRLQFQDAAAAEAARRLLEANPDVQGVESNYIVDQPPVPQQLDAAGAPPLRLTLNPPTGSGRVIVGLVDTAVQPLGNDLDKFLLKSLSVAGQAVPDPNSPTHGTSMYENLLRSLAAVTGGSSSVQVVSVDVYGPNPNTTSFSVAAGIVQAVNNGANVVNLSLGSPADSSFLHDVINQATQKGIVIIAAAGNDASNAPFYPSDYKGVTAVTAGVKGQLAPYANYGPNVSVIAPGSALVVFGNTTYLVNGTSSAAAFISGLTAGVADSKQISVGSAVLAISGSPAFQYRPAN
jgi:thermitase